MGFCVFLKKKQKLADLFTSLVSGRFQGFSEKKRLNAHSFAREFLQSSMLYRLNKSLKDVASLLVCTRKKFFCLGSAGFL